MSGFMGQKRRGRTAALVAAAAMAIVGGIVAAPTTAEAAPGDYSTTVIMPATVPANENFQFTVKVNCPYGGCTGANAPRVTLGVPSNLAVQSIGSVDGEVLLNPVTSPLGWGESPEVLRIADIPAARVIEFNVTVAQKPTAVDPTTMFTVTANESSVSANTRGGFPQSDTSVLESMLESTNRQVDLTMSTCATRVPAGQGKYYIDDLRYTVTVPAGAHVGGKVDGWDGAHGAWTQTSVSPEVWVWEATGPTGGIMLADGQCLSSLWGVTVPRLALEFDDTTAWPVGSTPSVNVTYEVRDFGGAWHTQSTRKPTSAKIVAPVAGATRSVNSKVAATSNEYKTGGALLYEIKSSLQTNDPTATEVTGWTVTDEGKDGFFDHAKITGLAVTANVLLQLEQLPVSIVVTDTSGVTKTYSGNTKSMTVTADLSAFPASGKAISTIEVSVAGAVPMGSQIGIKLSGLWSYPSLIDGSAPNAGGIANCVAGAGTSNGSPAAVADGRVCATTVKLTDYLSGHAYSNNGSSTWQVGKSYVGDPVPAGYGKAGQIRIQNSDPTRPLVDPCFVVVYPVGVIPSLADFVPWRPWGVYRPNVDDGNLQLSIVSVTDAEGAVHDAVKACVTGYSMAPGEQWYYWTGGKVTARALLGQATDRIGETYLASAWSYWLIDTQNPDMAWVAANTQPDAYGLDPAPRGGTSTIPGSYLRNQTYTGDATLIADNTVRYADGLSAAHADVPGGDPVATWSLFMFNNMTDAATDIVVCERVPREGADGSEADNTLAGPVRQVRGPNATIEYSGDATSCADGTWSDEATADSEWIRISVSSLDYGKAMEFEWDTAFAADALAGDTVHTVGSATFTNSSTSMSATMNDTSATLGPLAAAALVKKTNGQLPATPQDLGVLIEDEANPPTVTWTYEVTNTGNTVVSGVSVQDVGTTGQVSGVDCADLNAKLPLMPGQTGTCTASAAAVVGEYSNTATATAITQFPAGTDYQQVSATASSGYVGILRSLSFVKKTNGALYTAAPGAQVRAGDTVTWSYAVTNNGNVAIDDITVTDAGSDGTVSVDCGGQTSLQPYSSMTCTASGTAIAGQYSNTATLTGSDAYGEISATASSFYFGATGSLAIAATVNGAAAADADHPVKVKVGNPVTYGATVTNTSNVPVTTLAVTLGGSPATCLATSLAVGASTTCSLAAGNASAGLHTVAANAAGTATGYGAVSADTTTWYEGVTSGISIAVTTNGLSVASASAAPVVLRGSTVTWDYVVTNLSSDPIDSLVVTDSQLGPVTCPQTTLDVAESITCTATGTAAAGLYHTSATATGEVTSISTEVSDSDDSWYFGATTGLTIVAKALGVRAASADDAPYVLVGSAVPLAYEVTNTGNIAVTNPTLTATHGGQTLVVSCPTAIAAGATVTCTAATVAHAGAEQGSGSVRATLTTSAGDVAVGPVSDDTFTFGVIGGLIAQATIDGRPVGSATQAPCLASGRTASVELTVTNQGNTAVADLVSALYRSVEPMDWTDAAIVSNLTCDSVSLEPSASTTCRYDLTVEAGLHHLPLGATGARPTGGTVSDPTTSLETATGHTWYFGETKGVELTATVDGKAGPDQSHAVVVTPGARGAFAFTVTNTGNHTLTDIAVSVRAGATGAAQTASCPATELGVGGSMVCTVTGTMPQSLTEYRATVVGQSVASGEVTASAVVWVTPRTGGVDPTPTPSPSDPAALPGTGQNESTGQSGSTGLPATGTQAGWIAGAAMLVLGLGAVLLATRRRLSARR